MPDNIRVWLITGPEFTRVANALREVDHTLPTKFRSAMRKTATPVIRDVRMAASALPARGTKHTGLRARVAAGVGLRVSVGANAQMRFTTSMVDPQELNLPRGLDSGEAGWRHPVYGNMNNWVHQRGGSWFRETISDDRDLIENGLTDVLEDASHTIAAAGAGP